MLIQNRITEICTMDIHPNAKIGKGVLLDHGSGLVVGETAVIGDGCLLMHNVTLGKSGKGNEWDRHPKLGNNVFVGAHACILGNIKINDNAKIGAGSVVLQEVPEGCTAVGNPARIIQ